MICVQCENGKHAKCEGDCGCYKCRQKYLREHPEEPSDFEALSNAIMNFKDGNREI